MRDDRPRFSEFSLLLGVVIAASVAVTAADALLLQRTQAFFGGGALNRPFHVAGAAETVAYLAISLVYDLIYIAVVCLAAMQLMRLFRFRPAQRLFVGSLVSIGSAFAFAAVNYRIAGYFRDRFDLAVLRELAGGRLLNMFGWISGDTFQVLLVVPAVLLVLILVTRRLGRAGGAVAPPRPAGRALLGLAAGVAVLAVGHVALAGYPSMRFGLGNKISATSLDLAIRTFADYDRSPVLAAAQERLRRPGDPPGEAAPTIDATNGMNVFVVVIETFRSDVVFQEVDGEPVMPFLSALARQHAYTDFAVSNYGVTARAIQTVMSGSLSFHAGTAYLPEQLRRQGYRLHAVSAQDESFGDTRQRLRLEAFDTYFESSMHTWQDEELTGWQRMNRISLTLDSRLVNRRIFQALDAGDGTPFFFYVNFQDLHYPYFNRNMPMRFIASGRTDAGFFTAANAEAIRRQYANAARYLDGALRDFFAGLAERGLLERSVVVIVGDHPDSFYENGLLGHAWSVDQAQRRTPLLVVNGRGALTAPVGQDEILGLIREALRPDGTAPPLTFGLSPDKEVLVVSGPLDAPRQVALLGARRLVTYDFRTDRVQFGEDGPWTARRRVVAGTAEQVALQRLLDGWEGHLRRRQRDAAAAVRAAPAAPGGAAVPPS